MMMFSTASFIVALIATSSSVVLGSPTPSQLLSRSALARGPNTCSPNFFGSGIEITGFSDASLEMGVTPAATQGAIVGGTSFRGPGKPDWHVQQDGQDPTSYIIKDVDNNLLAVTFEGNELVLDTASNSGNQLNQLFKISCANCYGQGPSGSVVADYCYISPKSTSGTQCVSMSSPGPVTLVTCDETDDSQIFTFTLFN